jgi:alpha-soluble NSF attachment protein
MPFLTYYSEAATYLTKSVQLLSENGNFSTAARLVKDMAELFEKDSSYKEAAEQYEKAADMFNTEDVAMYFHQIRTCQTNSS